MSDTQKDIWSARRVEREREGQMQRTREREREKAESVVPAVARMARTLQALWVGPRCVHATGDVGSVTSGVRMPPKLGRWTVMPLLSSWL